MPKAPIKSDDEEHDVLDRKLDEELEESFPASDAPKVTRVPRRSQIISDDGEGTEHR